MEALIESYGLIPNCASIVTGCTVLDPSVDLSQHSPALIVTAESPVELEIVDPNGNHMTVDPNGNVVSTIDGGGIFKLQGNKTLAIVLNPSGEYSILIHGRQDANAEDTFDLGVLHPLASGGYSSAIFINAPTNPGATAEISVDETTTDYQLFVDLDSDGNPEESRSPDVVNGEPPAGLLFDNGEFSGGQSHTGNHVGVQWVYDDFVLTSDSIISSIFWLQHDPAQYTYEATEVSIFRDLPTPENLVFLKNLVATRVPNDTGLLFGFPGFDYSLTGLSISLSAGQYYLGLNAIGSGDRRTGWDQTSGGPDTLPGRRVVNENFPPPGTELSQDSVFRIFGTPNAVLPRVVFRRGDANADTFVDLSDAVFILLALFTDRVQATCEKAMDTNDDTQLDIADATYLLSFLFLQGDPPSPPLQDCGGDPTVDGLTCSEHPPCLP